MKEVIFDDLYQEKYILDKTKYRGRGRPRKIDYSPFMMVLQKMQEKTTGYLNKAVDESLKQKTSSEIVIALEKEKK